MTTSFIYADAAGRNSDATPCYLHDLHASKDVRIYDGGIELSGSYHMVPFPNYFAIAERIKEYAQLGIRGWFGEGSTSLWSDMRGLRTFLIGQQC